jgi:hypothetical protein
MKQVIAFLTLVIAYGASGQVFGIDITPYQGQDEVIQSVQLDHFEAVTD